MWWRHRPDSPLGIAVFVLLVVTGAVVVQWLGYLSLNNPYAERLKARTAHEGQFSPARFGYLLVVLLCHLLFFGLLWFAVVRLAPYLPSFMTSHVP